jgi:hypothetical protein
MSFGATMDPSVQSVCPERAKYVCPRWKWYGGKCIALIDWEAQDVVGMSVSGSYGAL